MVGRLPDFKMVASRPTINQTRNALLSGATLIVSLNC
jgi:hypothetical protein